MRTLRRKRTREEYFSYLRAGTTHSPAHPACSTWSNIVGAEFPEFFRLSTAGRIGRMTIIKLRYCTISKAIIALSKNVAIQPTRKGSFKFSAEAATLVLQSTRAVLEHTYRYPNRGCSYPTKANQNAPRGGRRWLDSSKVQLTTDN